MQSAYRGFHGSTLNSQVANGRGALPVAVCLRVSSQRDRALPVLSWYPTLRIRGVQLVLSEANTRVDFQ